MKICQVNPGCGIEIPPKGWGAIEKIVWEFTKNLRKQDYQVDIKWANEIKKGEYDLVHVHVANLALILAEKGIPYIFQCHDHHAYHHGKDSFVFKQNLEAIEKSELSILPAKYLVDYFGSNKAVYFSHGVDIEFFVPNLQKKSHKLLMVANNGLGGKDGYDRKGFTEGIQAAKKIKLPITIVGPENNKNFIKNNPWVKSYDINWIFNPNQEELLKLYQEHTIFLHPSELEAGHPNLTILEAMSCGLPVVGCMEDNLEGMAKAEKSVSSIYKGIKLVLKNYKEYQSYALHTANNLSWYNRSKELLNLVKPKDMKEILIKEYTNTVKKFFPIKKPVIKINLDFTEGPKCTINGGNPNSNYKVEFINKNNNFIEYTGNIKNGMWAKANTQYFIPWNIKITDLSINELICDYHFNLKNKKVYIKFESKAIGDTIAWFPYVEEFRKKHDCKIICSTFYNDWFSSTYSDIEFVNPGTFVEEVYASYKLGCFYNEDNKTHNPNLHPKPFLPLPLQQISSDILGLEYKELKPKLKPLSSSPIKEKYVTISIQSTSQCKYWNHPNGWEQVIKYLQNKGYKIVRVDKHKTFGVSGFMNEVLQCDYEFYNKPLEEILPIIKGAQFHIGISSGLSWVAWALNVPVVLISSFTQPHLEFQSNCTRIYNDAPTSGYWHTHRLDPSNWNWYPFKEIQSMEDWYKIETITPEQVINNIKQLL